MNAGRPLSLCFCLLLLLPALLHAQEAPTQAELDAINTAIERVEAQIDSASNERSRVATTLEEAERRINTLNSELRSINQQLREERERLQALQAERRQLQASRTEQQDSIAAYLRSAWQTGREEYLKLLLNQEDISQSARILRYYEYFNQARAEKIARFNATLDELASVEADITASSARLDQQQHTLNTRRAELQEQQQEREQALARVEQSLDSDSARLTQLQAQRDELTLLLEELRRSLASLDSGRQPFGDLRGQLPWPLKGPLLNRYGARQSQGDVTWQGVNIAAEPGTEIRAVHPGRVIFADWFRSSGLLLIIDHGDGYMSLYGQNQELLRAVGDWVNTGDVIATTGNTGGRREHSLYFEIRHNGRSQDPVAWCEARNQGP